MLRPRPETAFLDPFAERPTLVVRCGHLGRDERPLPQSPDTSVRSSKDAAAAALTLPRDFPGVGGAPELQRERLEAGGVFPIALIDALVTRLRLAG